MKSEKNYLGFLIHKLYQILKSFAGTFWWAQTSYFWRVYTCTTIPRECVETFRKIAPPKPYGESNLIGWLLPIPYAFHGGLFLLRLLPLHTYIVSPRVWSEKKWSPIIYKSCLIWQDLLKLSALMKKWVEGKSSKAFSSFFANVLPFLMIFQSGAYQAKCKCATIYISTSRKSSNLAKLKKKPCLTCLKPIFLADSWYPKIGFWVPTYYLPSAHCPALTAESSKIFWNLRQ